MPSDTTLTCRDCGQPFVFTVREQEYYASRGFDNAPGRCSDCRAAHKAQRGGEPPSSTNRGRMRCSARRARAAARKLTCRSSPAATGPSIARTATRTIAVRHQEAGRVDVAAPEDAAAVHALAVAAATVEPSASECLRAP